MKYRGTVSVNGQPYSKATRKRIGFVLQDDVLYESLTVKVGRLSRIVLCTDRCHQWLAAL